MRLYGMEDGIDISGNVLKWLATKQKELRQGGIDIVNCDCGPDMTGCYVQRYLVIVSGDNDLGEELTAFYKVEGMNVLGMVYGRKAFTPPDERNEFCKKVNAARLAQAKDRKEFKFAEVHEMVKTFVNQMDEKYREQ